MRNTKLLAITIILAIGSSMFTSCNSVPTEYETEPSAAESVITETSVHEETEPTPTPVEYLNEGCDTQVEITGYTRFESVNGMSFLKEGDKIAVLSPSALPSQKQLEAVIAGLTEWGYIPVEGKYVLTEGRTLENRIEDLVWAIEDPEIAAIFCVRGGYGASMVMDSIELSLIESSPKPIIGYSDITIYHSAWTSAGLFSIHATMSSVFTSDTLSEECKDAEMKILSGYIPSYKVESNALCKTGEAEGILIGGNLSTLVAVLNTAYDCTKNGQPYILFLEDVGEDINHINRLLTILDHAGVLNNAQGIIFGEWTDIEMEEDYDSDNQGSKYESVADMIDKNFSSDLDIPVAFGFPAGHGDSNYPLLMGASVKLNVSEDYYTIEWTESAY